MVGGANDPLPLWSIVEVHLFSVMMSRSDQRLSLSKMKKQQRNVYFPKTDNSET